MEEPTLRVPLLLSRIVLQYSHDDCSTDISKLFIESVLKFFTPGPTSDLSLLRSL